MNGWVRPTERVEVSDTVRKQVPRGNDSVIDVKQLHFPQIDQRENNSEGEAGLEAFGL